MKVTLKILILIYVILLLVIPSTMSGVIEDTNYEDAKNIELDQFPSHTEIPKTTFTGVYNATAFANPDNADKVIFDYLDSAENSIYVSMYTISRKDFTDKLIELKQENPSIDIQVLISKRRVGGTENADTKAAAEELVANLIPVYNSTSDDDKVDGFYHNKYWIIDGKHTFVYSGNWSPRSVTPFEESYSSGEPNRDMGIAVHNAPDIANFFKTEVWDKDVAVSSAWELPVGISITAFIDADVVSGQINIDVQASGLIGAAYSYRWDQNSFQPVPGDNNGFQVLFNTLSLSDGIHTFEVKAEVNGQEFTDMVDINVINSGSSYLLITELLPNPDGDDALGEFVEITNSYDFPFLLTGWHVGDDDDDQFIFPNNFQMNALSSIIIARNLLGFQAAFGVIADFEFSFGLVNSGDYVQLLDARGDYVDVVAYGGASAPDGSETIDDPPSGKSLQRTPLSQDTDMASDFIEADPDPKGAVVLPLLNLEEWETPKNSEVIKILPSIYTPNIDPLNIEEQMSLHPIFTPDNAIDIYTEWLNTATETIELQNQYITQFENDGWDMDTNPILVGLLAAKERGVTVRVQVNENGDSDDVTNYLLNQGIDVRWMGNSAANPDGEYLSTTHNKLIVIDDKVSIISSINFGENAFTNNREAGMVIENVNVAMYYKMIFEKDFKDGEIPPLSTITPSTTQTSDVGSSSETTTAPLNALIGILGLLVIARGRKNGKN